MRRISPLLLSFAGASLVVAAVAAGGRSASAQSRPYFDGGIPLGRIPWLIDASTPDTTGTSVVVQAAAPATTAVATGRGLSVTASEVLDRVRDSNELEQRRFASDPAALEGIVDRIVADRLLAAEARRRGLENDPAVRAAIERALIGRLRATVLNPTADSLRVTDQEARAFYDSNAFRFHIPERRRVAVLFTSDLSRLQRETRRWSRLDRPQLRRAFRELTRQLTTDDEIIRAEYEFADITESRDDLDDALRRATFSLRDEGDVTPEPVQGSYRGRRGYWMVRLVDKRAAIDRTFEESADWIRGRIAAERRLQVERDTVLRLSEQAGVRRTPASSVVRVQVVADAGNIDAGL